MAVFREEALTVGDLLEALKDGRVKTDTRLGYAIRGLSEGVDAITNIGVEKYADGTTVLLLSQDKHAGQLVVDEVPLEADDLI